MKRKMLESSDVYYQICLPCVSVREAKARKTERAELMLVLKSKLGRKRNRFTTREEAEAALAKTGLGDRLEITEGLDLYF